MNEIIKAALLEKFEKELKDFDKKKLSSTSIDKINREQLTCIITCLQTAKPTCVPKFVEINNAVGCRVGECDCRNIVRSYEKFCSDCGKKLNWDEVQEN